MKNKNASPPSGNLKDRSQACLKALRLPRKIRNPYRHKISASATHHLAQILEKTPAQQQLQTLRHPPTCQSFGCAVAVDVDVDKAVVKAAVGVAVSRTEKTDVELPPPTPKPTTEPAQKTKEPTREVVVTDGEGRAVPPYQRRWRDRDKNGRNERTPEYLERARVLGLAQGKSG